jgi:hypothetical protein
MREKRMCLRCGKRPAKILRRYQSAKRGDTARFCDVDCAVMEALSYANSGEEAEERQVRAGTAK